MTDEPEKLAASRSPYEPKFAEQARKLCQLGATDSDLADFFEVTDRTIRAWRTKHEEFAEAAKVGKDVADDRVEMSLYRKATGYTFESEKIFCHEGVVMRVPVTEHVAPSDTACIFWLKNRRRLEWRDKQEVEHTGKVSVTISGADADL